MPLTKADQDHVRAALTISRHQNIVVHRHDWDVADALAAVVGALGERELDDIPAIVICTDEAHQAEQETMKADVARMRASVDKLMALTSPAEEPPAWRLRVRAVHSALAELVRLKGLKDEGEAIQSMIGPIHPHYYNRAIECLSEHAQKAPSAWHVARVALDELEPGDV